MKFLMEHEMAFDVAGLGFPSVKGCLALVYQTPAGLYGFHITQCNWDRTRQNALLFRDFIIQHGHGTERLSAGTRLYGVTFVGQRYGGNKHAEWRQEMEIFANALLFKGKTSGYNLTESYPGDGRSAYVLYTPNGDKCAVDIREWGVHEATHAKVDNHDHVNYKWRKAAGFNVSLANLTRIVPGIQAGALTRVHKEKLG
jgi:hypothetical protein